MQVHAAILHIAERAAARGFESHTLRQGRTERGGR
jgi:hypothetical protein